MAVGSTVIILSVIVRSSLKLDVDENMKGKIMKLVEASAHVSLDFYRVFAKDIAQWDVKSMNQLIFPSYYYLHGFT